MDLVLNLLKKRLPTSLPTEDMSFLFSIFITCFVQTLTFFFFVGMATMKENKGKGLADKETMQEGTHSQPHLAVRDKRKTSSKIFDMGSLPSRRGHKKVKHKSSKSGVVKPGSIVPPTPTKQPFVQIFDLESSNPPETNSSKPIKSASMNLLKNEDLAWERYQQAVTEEDVVIC